MTNMKRTTVSFPAELTERIFALRRDDRYVRYSYSELIRQLVEKGLARRMVLKSFLRFGKMSK